MSFLGRFVGDRCGGLRVNVLGIVLIIVTFIVWVATFTPVFMVVDKLVALTDSAQVASIVRLCNLAAGACLLSEVVAYLIWMVVSAFKEEDQTFYGGVFDA